MIVQLFAYWIVVQPTTFCQQIGGKANSLKLNSTEHFSIYLADEQEVSAVGKVKCFVDLGPMKTALAFHVLQCDFPCVLGILFL